MLLSDWNFCHSTTQVRARFWSSKPKDRPGGLQAPALRPPDLEWNTAVIVMMFNDDSDDTGGHDGEVDSTVTGKTCVKKIAHSSWMLLVALLAGFYYLSWLEQQNLLLYPLIHQSIGALRAWNPHLLPAARCQHVITSPVLLYPCSSLRLCKTMY